ncbi:MAG: protein kinase, partial [Anaerolineae bacterium]
MSSLALHLLGPPRIERDGEPVQISRRKAVALLAYLAITGRSHSRDALATLLWPEADQSQARAGLRRALAALKKVLGEGWLDVDRETVGLNPDPEVCLDVSEFHAQMAKCRTHDHPIDQDCPACLSLLAEATALYRDDFLAGFTLRDSPAFDDWQFFEAQGLRDNLAGALERLARGYSVQGEFEQAIPYARRWLALDPLHEPAHRCLMRLYAQSGQRAAALARYEACRQVLRDELGVEPTAETTALYEQIQAGELEAPTPAAASPVPIVRGYELRERIGAGGFGEVYLAYQPSVGRQVAVKVILPQYADHPDFVRRFETEAQLVARLEHPYIVPLYDYWREPGGAYLVMRWLRGGNLYESLQRGPWTPEAAAQLLDQVAGALAVAHRRGVVHRDVKPENILLDGQGNAYLSDFGFAKDLLRAAGTASVSIVPGSLAYMSPEQAQSKPVSAQSDLYSLGIVMYETLTGEHPFPDLTPATQLIKQLTEPLPPLRERRPDLPEALEEVIQRAAAKDPAERYPDALAFAAAFREAVLGPGAEAVTRPPDRAALEMVNPYKGLRAFEEADAADFFGREVLTEQLLARLGEDGTLRLGSGQEWSRFLAVVGPSGSGKSSAVKAGLLPALRRGALPGSEEWFIVEMLPGAHPLDELEIGLLRVAVQQPVGLMGQLRRDERGLLRAARLALPTDRGELLLVIDQFEELFTRAADTAESKHLMQSLYAAVSDPRSPVRVVITLRADFYDRPLMHPDFSQLMRQRTEVVVPLTAEELAEAIRKPAEQAGAELETGLVTAIVTDVSEQPGALPMLQYALTELFERREGRTLTRAAYRAIGGVSGALARRAEEVYAGLDEAAQRAARQLFLRLVTLGEGVEDTRRRVLRGELKAIDVDQQAMDAVIDTFGRSRLLLFDRDPATREPTAEVAHEALLREWRRLRGWLDESRADVRTQRLLASAAGEWIEADRDPGFLLRGTRLDQFELWSATTDLALTRTEREYLDASRAEREARRREEAERQAREAALERRSRTFLRALVAVLGIATVIALVLTGFAFTQRREALEAYSQSLAAHAQNALDDKDSATGLVMALEANDIDRPPEISQRVLRQAAYAPGARHRFAITDTFKGVEGKVYSLTASPTERVFLIGFAGGTIVLWDLDTETEIHRLVGHTGLVRDLAFSPDGRKALSGSNDRTVILWDLETGQEIRRFSGHAGWVRAVAFSPDGRTMISGGFVGDFVDAVENPGELILWDLETGQEIRRFEGHPSGVQAVAFSPDGGTVLASSGVFGTVFPEYSLILWDLETGESVHRFDVDHDNFSLAISPDGSTALSGDNNSNVYLWNLETGEKTQTLEGHQAVVTAVAFTPDGRRAISGDWEGRLILWDLATGRPIVQAMIHQTLTKWSVGDPPPVNVAIAAGGRVALSSSGDGSLILWDLFDAGEIQRFKGHTAAVFGVAFTPDGQYALTGGGYVGYGPVAEDNNLRLWNVETGKLIRVFEGHAGAVTQIAIDSDGRRALSSAFDGTVRLWDLETGAEIRRFQAHPKGVFSVAFGPDGRTALSGPYAYDDVMILWDLESSEA